MSAHCFACEKGRLVLTNIPEVVQHNGKDVLVPDYEALVCDHCGERFVSPALSRKNSPRIADAKRKSEGLLTGGEVAEVRDFLGLSQQVAATVFGGGPNAFSKYERGEVVQSKAMDLLLRLAVEVPAAREALLTRAGVHQERPSENGWTQVKTNVVRANFVRARHDVSKIEGVKLIETAGPSNDWRPVSAAGGC